MSEPQEEPRVSLMREEMSEAVWRMSKRINDSTEWWQWVFRKKGDPEPIEKLLDDLVQIARNFAGE